MNRREAIKGITTWGALAIFPNLHNATGTIEYPGKQGRRTHFVGLGDAGCNVLRHFHARGIDAEYTCISRTPGADIPEGIEYIQYPPSGEIYADGNGRNSPEVFHISSGTTQLTLPFTLQYMVFTSQYEVLPGQPYALPNKVRQLFSHDHQYVLLAGLGGYTGTRLASALTPWLKKMDREFITICSLPFRFEGDRRRIRAEKALNRLRSIPNFKSYQMENLGKRNGRLAISKALENANEDFYRIYEQWAQPNIATVY